MSINIDKIVDHAKNIMQESKELKEKIDEIEEWNTIEEIIENISSIVGFIVTVVKIVEQTAMDIGKDLTNEIATSKDKMEAAAKIIDDFIPLPFWLEALDRIAIKIILSVVVHFLNDKLGKNWLD